ncbi:MAG: hypothetical protein CND89_03745 [Marine Group II euryarchaeote MED-G38]|nr:MAG: hypothetical protein CND89_03745 [Marine Group II euryarchaeote MED-G38]
MDLTGRGIQAPKIWLKKSISSGIKLGLNNCTEMLNRLGNPQKKFSSIHVAGTNGKGSLCANLSAIGSKNGLLVGLFSSPHLITVEERARIDGRPVSSDLFNRCLSLVHEVSLIEPIIEPTYFEITFLTSLLAFSESKIDIAIIETGLGGRLDSTRLVEAQLCAITTISKDHSEILGETLVEIASEKAHIYRPNIPLFSLFHSDYDVREVFTKIAGSDLKWFNPRSLKAWDISKEYAIYIANYLGWKIDDYQLNWLGRSEDNISWIPGIRCRVSAAHNIESIENELNSLDEEVVMLIGMTSKPDIYETLSPFRGQSRILHTIVTEPSKGRKRPIDPQNILDELEKLGLSELEIIYDLHDAITKLEIIAKKLDCSVLIIGSIYLVGEIMNYVIVRDSLDMYDILTIHPPLK